MRNRLRQFFTANRRATEDDLAFARGYLSPPLFSLFLGQHPRDVRHGVDTARWLLGRGVRDPDVLAAALLHDVGKGHQRRLDRVAYVVAGWFRLQRMLADPSSRFELRRAVARSVLHADRGAALLAEHGAPPRVVELTRRHHEQAGGDAMLALLQEADRES